jgi:hypothetical protein
MLHSDAIILGVRLVMRKLSRNGLPKNELLFFCYQEGQELGAGASCWFAEAYFGALRDCTPLEPRF